MSWYSYNGKTSGKKNYVKSCKRKLQSQAHQNYMRVHSKNYKSQESMECYVSSPVNK
jgi:hypothetical protein